MIDVLNGAAVLTKVPASLKALSNFEMIDREEASRTYSPSALYALKAVKLLAPNPMPQAMVCLSGPTGMMADQFEAPIRLSSSGKLGGSDFSKNSRRIHPLTLIRSLQNQIPSAVSQEFQIHGPVLNSLDSATAVAYLMPNICHLIHQGYQVLLIFASAADRREEKAKRDCFRPGTVGAEGAFAFILGGRGGVGKLAPIETSDLEALEDFRLPGPSLGDPILAAGLELFSCLQQNPARQVLCFQDAGGHQAHMIWRKC